MGQFAIWAGSLLAWFVVVFHSSTVADWPQWRGPRRDGLVAAFKAPAEWPKDLHKQWQVEVGLGHSSPVVAAGNAYIFSRRDDDEVLACVRLADGKELWRHGYPAPYQVNPAASAHGKGPKSTPVIAGRRIVTFGISGILTCRDLKTGKRHWQREFSKQFEATSPLYGAAMSPAVDQDHLIVHVGGHDKGALLALDLATGETVWSCGEDGPAYASPVVTTLADVRQVITLTQKACVGVDAETGKPLWRIPFATEYDQNTITPLVHEGSVIISGINKGVDRYRIEKTDDQWQADKVWPNREVSLYMSSPVADADKLFGFSHRQKGQLFAIDLTTGKTLWTSEGRLGDNASLVRNGKVLWALTTGGELIVFLGSDKKFEPLARYKVADTPTWAHPVVGVDGVLVKDETKLTLWQFPK